MKKSKYLILFSIALLVVSGYLFYKQYLGVSEFHAEYPFTLDVSEKKSFTCDAQITSLLEANKDSISGEKDGIKASLKKGTDQVVINIESDTVEFLTHASFEAGVLDGATFQKLRDDDKYLIAALNYKTNTGIETFVVDKQTGLATWVRNEVSSFTNHPDIQAYYLICR